MANELIEYIPGETRLSSASTDELRTELANALKLTARHLLHMAAIWQELERRGEDLSDLRVGLATYLPLIAAETLEAELVVRLAGRRGLLDRYATLPISEQRRLLTNDSVGLAIMDNDRVVIEQAHPLKLTLAQANLLIGDGRIRSMDEQHQIIKRRAVRAKSSSINHRNLERPEEQGASFMQIAHFNKINTDIPQRTIAVRMTADEYVRLKSKCVDGVTIGSLVYAALKIQDII